MSVPVYLAVKNEVFIHYPRHLIIQTGYGIQKSGELRIPKSPINGPVMVDDAVLESRTPNVLSELSKYCWNGYILDFERPFCSEHRKIIAGLPQEKLLALPAQYFSSGMPGLPILACTKPCNSWMQFLRKNSQQFPEGWMLEITPWNFRRRVPCLDGNGILTAAVCRYRIENSILTCYDTVETLKEKLKQAEKEGCRAGIALLEEVQNLK